MVNLRYCVDDLSYLKGNILSTLGECMSPQLYESDWPA